VDSPIEEAHDDHPLFGSADRREFVTRSQRRAATRPPKRHHIAPLLAIAVIVALLGSGYFLVQKFRDSFDVADYSGSGGAVTQIRVNPGDGAGDVGKTLKDAGVVASTKAFINAAQKSGKAERIQPGLYNVRLKSSAQAALDAILDPKNLLVTRVTVPEGRTRNQTLTALADKTKVPLKDLVAASNKIANLGLPSSLKPTTPEGVLFPATYEFDPTMDADAVVQKLTEAFNTAWVELGMDDAAKRLRLTHYQVLIIASMVESEAKFPEDRPKIARVILNRLAQGMALKIDAVNRYGAGLLNLDAHADFEKINSPYNTYTHRGLPPTPISSPGEASLKAAAAPATGNWLYYVVNDAAGHHLFTKSDQEFEAAREKCVANGWGCG